MDNKNVHVSVSRECFCECMEFNTLPFLWTLDNSMQLTSHKGHSKEDQPLWLHKPFTACINQAQSPVQKRGQYVCLQNIIIGTQHVLAAIKFAEGNHTLSVLFVHFNQKGRYKSSVNSRWRISLLADQGPCPTSHYSSSHKALQARPHSEHTLPVKHRGHLWWCQWPTCLMAATNKSTHNIACMHGTFLALTTLYQPVLQRLGGIRFGTTHMQSGLHAGSLWSSIWCMPWVNRQSLICTLNTLP